MPPAPPRAPQARDDSALTPAERPGIYDIIHNVTAPRRHFQHFHPGRLVTTAPLPQGAIPIYVRQIQTLLNPRESMTDDLVDTWFWWFNIHQPAEDRMWVPQLACAHTLIAPPAPRRPAPSPGATAAPQPRADNLNIPPYTNLDSWECTIAPEKGRSLRDMVDRCAREAEATHAVPPSRNTPNAVLVIMLKAGHYYHVRVTARPADGRWDLEGIDSMIIVAAPLPDGPTLIPGQPPDPLTAITSGQAANCQAGHALYCLWQWARRRWPATRAWTVAWRLHQDGLQHTEATPPGGMEDPPTTANLCTIFAVHHVRTLSGRVDPTIPTETEARAAYAALVYEMVDALRSAQIRPGTSQPP